MARLENQMTLPTINEPEDPIERPASTEEELRAEIERLTRQLQQKHSKAEHNALEHPKQPKGRTIALLMTIVAVLLAVAFFAGYIPQHRRDLQVIAEASAQSEALPDVSVVAVKKASTVGDLVLPGNIQPVTEAPILARAEGYVRRRYADIGDRVTAGQLLAEVEAPDLDQQVRQAQAAVEQARRIWPAPARLWNKGERTNPSPRSLPRAGTTWCGAAQCRSRRTISIRRNIRLRPPTFGLWSAP